MRFDILDIIRCINIFNLKFYEFPEYIWGEGNEKEVQFANMYVSNEIEMHGFSKEKYDKKDNWKHSTRLYYEI